MSPTPPPMSPAATAFAREVAPQLRSVVDATSAIGLDEIRARATPASRPRTSSGTMAWRLAAAAVVVLLLVGGGIGWQVRDAAGPVADAPPADLLLPIPANPTGPIPAANTAASPGEPSRSTSARWDVVRTGADDRQLVVYFDGGGCGTFRADVTETDDAVSIAILPVFADDGRDCPTVAGPGAIGIQLAQPLADRRLEGSRPADGNDVSGPLVVPGPDLATLAWPAGSVRASAEDLHRGLGPDAYVWTQRFDGPAGEAGGPQSVSLEQWRGATPIDDGAVYQTCRGEAGTTEAVPLNGTEATLVRCSSSDESPPRSGALAILWMDGADRLMIRADPGNAQLDGTRLVELAATVHRGS